MGKYKVMKPAQEVDVSAVKYKEEDIKGWFYALAKLAIHMNTYAGQDLDCRISFVPFLHGGLFVIFAAPHLTGFLFKLFVNMLETPLIGSSIVDSLKKNNGMTEVRFYITLTL